MGEQEESGVEGQVMLEQGGEVEVGLATEEEGGQRRYRAEKISGSFSISTRERTQCVWISTNQLFIPRSLTGKTWLSLCTLCFLLAALLLLG